jgi:FG-GAP repeat
MNIKYYPALAVGTLCIAHGIAAGQVAFDAIELEQPANSSPQWLGVSASMFGNRGYFGAPGDSIAGTNAGAVYRYELSDSNSPPNLVIDQQVDADDRFGTSLAARNYSFGDGNLTDIVIGAPGDEGPNGAQGAIYLFEIFGDLHGRIYDPNGQPGDDFGASVAFTQGQVAAGAPGSLGIDNEPRGSVVVFDPDTTGFPVLYELSPDENTMDFSFGESLDMQGIYIIAGAPGYPEDLDPPNLLATRGAAYVYFRSTGTLFARLRAPVRTNNARFGSSVSVNDGQFLIGAPGDSVAVSNAGAAYFQSGNSQMVRITPPDLDPGDEFGFSVDHGDDFLLVGAPGDDDAGEDAGAVYVYRRDSLLFINKILPSPPFDVPGTRFGSSVAQDTFSDSFITGAPVANAGQGAAFDLENNCRADFDENGLLNFFDVNGFLFFQTDWNGDGLFNFFDVSGFLFDFTTGCRE